MFNTALIPNVGELGASVEVSAPPSGLVPVADAHRHGASTDNAVPPQIVYQDENFSGAQTDGVTNTPAQNKLVTDGTTDIGQNNCDKIYGILGTPGGTAQKYDPSKGIISNLPGPVPSDAGARTGLPGAGVSAPSTSTCTVKAGDTLWGISRRYKTSVENIKKENKIKDDNIKAGDTINVGIDSDVVPDGIIDFERTVVKTEQSYNPFGMLQPRMSYTMGGSKYTFGFNDQERSDEVYGKGNLNTALFWEYDTRLGRRWNIDLKPSDGVSNYSVLTNNPIIATDILGDTVLINLFKSDDVTFFNNAEKMVLNKKDYKDGVFIIAAHGNFEMMENSKGPNLWSPEEVVNFLKENESYNKALQEVGIITIIFAACNLATEPEEVNPAHKGRESIAQGISGKLPENHLVIAPTGYCYYGPCVKKNVPYGHETIGKQGNGGVVGFSKINDKNKKNYMDQAQWLILHKGKVVDSKGILDLINSKK